MLVKKSLRLADHNNVFAVCKRYGRVQCVIIFLWPKTKEKKYYSLILYHLRWVTDVYILNLEINDSGNQQSYHKVEKSIMNWSPLPCDKLVNKLSVRDTVVTFMSQNLLRQLALLWWSVLSFLLWKGNSLET